MSKFLDQTLFTIYCPIAQLAEQEIVNFKVARSNRAGTAIYGDCDVIRSITDCESV